MMEGLRYTLLIVIVLLQYAMKAESGERTKVRNECIKVKKMWPIQLKLVYCSLSTARI